MTYRRDRRGRGAGAHLLVAALTLAGLLTACGGRSGPQPLEPDGPGPTAGTAQPAPDPAANQAELRTLWESTLAVFGAAPEERTVRLAALGPRVPGDLDAAARRLQPLQARTFTSRADYQLGAGSQATITDCAASSSPSVLGATTVGFKAEARRPDPAGQWTISSVTLVPLCVPRADGEAALAAYGRFHASETRLWGTLDPADPALDLVTSDQRAKLLASFEEHRRYGWQETRRFDRQTVEVVGVGDDGSIRLDLCTAFSADSGVYQGNQRVAGSELPGQWHQQATMVKQEGRWLFDGFTETSQGCLFAPTDKAAPLL